MKRWTLFVILAGMAALVCGKWSRPSQAPIARLIANAERNIHTNIGDGDSHFLLARLYSLQYAGESGQVGIYDPDGKPNFPVWQEIQVKGPLKHTPKGADALKLSLDHYALSSKLLSSDARVRLGQGWMLEEASKWVYASPTQTSSETSLRKLTSRQWLQLAVATYEKAYELSKRSDGSKDPIWQGSEEMASLESAENLVRLSSAKSIVLPKSLLAELEAYVAEMQGKVEAMTPIVYPLDSTAPYSALDSPKAKVKFDLDGSGLPRRWSWITPRAAFLCWNPLGDGKIDSARDLFGNATFWMFFRNGYDALAALDDNRDGELAGPELRFIAAWHDKNANGISEPGEVKKLGALGIVRIAVRPQGRKGAVWFNRSGIGLANGKSLPTYDWVARRQR